MSQTEPTEIYYSKTAYRFGLLIPVVMIGGGFVLMTVVQNDSGSFAIHPFTKFGIIGILLIVLAVLLTRVYVKKLMDNRPALIMDDMGLTINGKHQKVISWDKIDHVEVVVVRTSNPNSSSRTKFVVPVLKSPEDYYRDTAKNILGALDNADVNATVGQPVQISTTFLKCSVDELKELLENRLEEYKKGAIR